MPSRTIKLCTLTLVALGSLIVFGGGVVRAQKRRATPALVVPRMWVDADMQRLEIPLADARYSPVPVTAAYYYSIPVRPIYRTYPVYAPGKEPPGYLAWLKAQMPEIVFDARKLKTRADWTKAGELVFDTPIATGGLGSNTTALYVRDPAWYAATGASVARDGTLPFYRYVVKEKGKVEVGILGCAMCHTRVMPDGTIVKGAQGNMPFDRAIAYDYRAGDKVEDARLLDQVLFTTPWVQPAYPAQPADVSLADLAAMHAAIPPGVLARHRSSPLYPVQVPDIIGVRARHYLDRSGLQLHRSIVDLMRYAALNQGGDDLSAYGDFTPVRLFTPDHAMPDPKTQERYSDEQLYALALYVYALKPPPNPNKFDAAAARGQKIFHAEGCADCHTPPLYTSNKLTLAQGFTAPARHLKLYNILPISVGTDPNLTLRTRRGTGYYKVPSLRGVWYRGPFEHDGSVMTLEDWFDPRRTRADYVPTGWRGYDAEARAVPQTRAVKGHPFGLNLSEEDRKDLITFLRTL